MSEVEKREQITAIVTLAMGRGSIGHMRASAPTIISDAVDAILALPALRESGAHWDENAQRYYTAKELADLLDSRDSWLARRGLFSEYASEAALSEGSGSSLELAPPDESGDACGATERATFPDGSAA